MNGIHDMGGMHGMGPMEIETNEPVFHEPWEGRVYALANLLGPWGTGRDWSGFRYTLESIPPAEYLRMSYYERWFSMNETQVLNSGLVTAEELANGHADPNLPVPQLLPPTGTPPLEPGLLDMDIAAAFRTEQQVRVKERNSPGHNRLPRYTRGKLGMVVSDNGVYALQDTDTEGQLLGNFPQHVYTVRFAATELWGDSGHENDAVYVDFWEVYLEAA